MPEDTTNVILIGLDHGKVSIRRDIAVSCSLLLRELLDNEPSSSDVEVPVEVPREDTLKLVAQYMLSRWQNKPRAIERPLAQPLQKCVDALDYDISSSWSVEMTLDLLAASNFLHFVELRDLCCAKVASYMMDMSTEGIRAMLGVQKDFTDEEERELKTKHGIPYV
eukprot:GILI01018835.1.p1 GENE.GILI01018835.1~~GILI01018835.1.p1  ORF type:complete len:189 (-),score=33.62 GILI01018835.1:75-572(-)